MNTKGFNRCDLATVKNKRFLTAKNATKEGKGIFNGEIREIRERGKEVAIL